MFVQVAIDLALDRLFTYEVPVMLEKKLSVGQLLSVPFGPRHARGFAMRLTDTPPAGVDKLKPITAIDDEQPFFSRELLDLVERMARYTASPLEAMLKAALPAAVLKRNVRVKERLFVTPVVPPPAPVESLAARRRWLYEQLVRLDGGWLNALVKELDTTAATLRALAADGFLEIAERQIRRNPLGRKRILPTKPLPLNDEQSAALAAMIASAPCGDNDDVGRARTPAAPHCGDDVATIAQPDVTANPGRPESGPYRLANAAPSHQSLAPSHQSPATNHQPPIPPAPRPFLLHGITGSGKTEVYLQLIAHELEHGRGAIVMVPEIALTPQTLERFASRFGERVAVLHSALSDGERFDEWHRIRSGEARVVVGPRSAVFAPVVALGVIIVDEEHEPSYKQEDAPRYHARDAAVLRGALEGAKVVLGSATPSLESWRNVELGKYRLLTLAHRAGAGSLPAVKIVERAGDAAGAIFTGELLEAIRLRLDRGEQTILFLNRRGYSGQFTCGVCGEPVKCPACDRPYTYHRVGDCLRCHLCGGWTLPPAKCPACGAAAFTARGVGTQRAELALRKCFPSARVLRMDADTVARKGSHDEILSAFRRGEAEILIGTQMIAKGLDFPNVTLVGVLNADAALNQPDFRAAERTFQLLAQVAGRAGRAELPGEVIFQTRDPSVSVLHQAAANDYARFAAAELADRREAYLPPFCHLATVNLRSQDAATVEGWAKLYAASLAKVPGLTVGDAVPSAIEKADGWYRWQIVLRADKTSTIVSAWRWIRAARPYPKKNFVGGVDIDAISLV